MWIYFGCCELSLFKEQTFFSTSVVGSLPQLFFLSWKKKKIRRMRRGSRRRFAWVHATSQLKQIIISTQCTMLSQRIIASNWILPSFAANPNISFPTYVCECVYVQGLCRTCALYLVKGPGGQLQLPDIPKTKIRSETYIKINLITIS